MSPFAIVRWYVGCALGLVASALAEGVPDIGLTASEREWIARHPVIRVGNDPTFAPFALRDQNGAIVGIDQDFLTLIGQRTGLRFVVEARSDWALMLDAFKNREVDVLASIGRTEEREKMMDFTTSYTYSGNGIITRNDAPYLVDLRDLDGRTVCVPRGYVGLLNELSLVAPGHRMVELEDAPACYRAVSRGEVFASICNVANAAYVVKSAGLANLRLNGLLSVSEGIFFGVRKDWPELTSIMNKAIASITPSERMKINDRWLPMDYRLDPWWVMAFRGIAVVVALVLVFLLGLLFHSRRLTRELRERQRIQRELEEAHRKLAQVNEQKSELLRMVAHDLRNPATGIVLGMDLLKTMGRDDRQTLLMVVDQLRTTAQQMVRMVDDLVDVHAIEEGQRTLCWEDLDAVRLMHDTVRGFGDRAALKNIRLRSEFPTAPLLIVSDRVALEHIAENLISNALKYSPRNTEIRVGLESIAGGFRLRVQDEGPGIDAQTQSRLFQKYSRGPAQPTAGEKSTGLGLWIVHRIVTELHGRVRCESSPGAGAAFIVELPTNGRRAASVAEPTRLAPVGVAECVR